MIPPAAERFLTAHTRAFLFTLRSDGAPACHPMVAFYRDGALLLTTYRKSAKAQNIARDARVACVVLTADDAPTVSGVAVRGRAEVVSAEGFRASASSGPRVAAGRDAASKVQARLAEGKRVVLRIVPEEVRLIGAHA